ncbi:HIT domain-containing protein [Hymenobacter sp. BT188]|uniref:nuclease A inhibitor family protein n=1 Tax=Hymenobacter sp. BT188 TaxID=2763504 RepID=UPI0016514F79|nr:nuclease A inhibitor family protein [Hymenobacter sp. BT188]MBC6607818.1 HIT domain-containing protein [Hymenobacter sp. BT188]
MPSIFSRIISGELPAFKVAEDADHLAFLDITPLVEGHTLVIPKREVDYIFDLPPAELAGLHQFAQRVAQAVRDAVPCKRIGVAVIGLEVPHAHIHLIPMNRVSDMNFANPKIKVAEARMKELADAISAKLLPEGEAGPTGQATEPAPDSKAVRETSKAKMPPSADTTAPTSDTVMDQLQTMTKGLFYMSESDAPLEAVSYAAPNGELTDAALLKLLGQPDGSPVETKELTVFLRNHTADNGVLGNVELANRYKALQMFMKQELQEAKVYRIGKGPQIQAFALGKTEEGKLVGFKTVLTET